MPEQESMHPEVATALRAYEIEVRDGTRRSQERAFQELQEKRRLLGGAALAITQDQERPPKSRPEPDTQDLAAS